VVVFLVEKRPERQKFHAVWTFWGLRDGKYKRPNSSLRCSRNTRRDCREFPQTERRSLSWIWNLYIRKHLNFRNTQYLLCLLRKKLFPRRLNILGPAFCLTMNTQDYRCSTWYIREHCCLGRKCEPTKIGDFFPDQRGTADRLTIKLVLESWYLSVETHKQRIRWSCASRSLEHMAKKNSIALFATHNKMLRSRSQAVAEI